MKPKPKREQRLYQFNTMKGFAQCFVSSAAAIVLMLGFATPLVSAQDATPAVDLVTPNPAECQIELRTVDNLMGFLSMPSAAPPTPEVVEIPAGEPADEEIVAGMTATTHGLYACYNANSFLQVFAFYTEEYVARTFPDLR